MFLCQVRGRSANSILQYHLENIEIHIIILKTNNMVAGSKLKVQNIDALNNIL